MKRPAMAQAAAMGALVLAAHEGEGKSEVGGVLEALSFYWVRVLR